MIIVKLMGGLGNQMFQYATARRLAQANSALLKLDLSWFSSIAEVDTPRHYELHALSIQENCATREEMSRLRQADRSAIQRMARKLVSPFCRETHIRERHFHFDPMILTLSGDVYLEGYWQSERYFKDIDAIIRREFTVKGAPDAWNGGMAEVIDGTESVALHVRRGDYVTSTAASEFHGVCSLDYYRAAIAAVAARVRSPHFFVFSDDPAWVKKNLAFDHPATFVDHNDPDHGYEDLRLMSLCKHHVIANSSFSWWGAWLGTDPGKIVIAPKKWFRDESIDTADLIPETWMRM